MHALEGYRPRRGLSVPLLTAMDRQGRLDEASQRRLVRHAVSEGRGADILFAAGTTGEAMALEAGTRRALAETVVDEARACPGGRPPEVWIGVTMRTARETLGLLRHAVDCGADAAVIAPLSIADLGGDVPGFFQGGVRETLESGPRMLPIFLYDNADIAVDPRVPHLKTAVVKRLSRLEFVRGIKVSAPLAVLGNYAKAASHFNATGSFGIYTGNARLVFEIFDTERGPFRRYLDRLLMHYSLPVGVVAGQANAFPREWQDAWRTAVAGDEGGTSRYREAFSRLSAACRPPASGARSIACLKRILASAGILASDRLAPGTPALSPAEAAAFDAAFAGVRRLLTEAAPARWTTPWPSRSPQEAAP